MTGVRGAGETTMPGVTGALAMMGAIGGPRRPGPTGEATTVTLAGGGSGWGKEGPIPKKDGDAECCCAGMVCLRVFLAAERRFLGLLTAEDVRGPFPDLVT
jgi:hypothetical protein